ncbi:hypothetical protein ACA877_004662 [Vibrio alginolyticus]|jgi:hypothetical protein|uniref:hypothetical protein n=1 Tax=Vibrio alginolyticus TaxID=663 RepID=UPI0006CA9FA0|nr:hypothetical protein [Vibrio alginolyticus]ELA8079172.1 hypothetical protein [Vibrio alginolyticus]KPM98769.1 hypothetical protein AOR11_23505 [Vibrio alginolyticus]MBT0052402.1 hypothetical protein [Vibrio alginolyticus]
MKIMKALLAVLLMIPLSAHASESELETKEQSSALELEMNLVIVAKDGQSMQTLDIGNIELFRGAKVGTTHVNQGKDFFLAYAVPADGSSIEKPKFDVSITLVSDVFDGKNESNGHVQTMEPHQIFVMTTKDSDVIEYQFDNVELGKPLSKTKKSSRGKSTRINLQLK